MKKDLKNKNCLITGATGGIGKEIAKEIAKNSCNLFLTGRKKEDLEKMKKDFEKKFKIKVDYQNGDLTHMPDLMKIIAKAKLFGKIDILINSAGIFIEKSIEKTTIEEFEKCHAINVRTPFILSKELSKNMKKRKWGRIVNIASSSAHQGFSNGSAYCSSKHGLLGLSRSMFNELKQKNVRVFCVSPGSSKTKMGKQCKNQNFETFINPKEIAEYIVNIISFDNEMIIEESRLNRIKIE